MSLLSGFLGGQGGGRLLLGVPLGRCGGGLSSFLGKVGATAGSSSGKGGGGLWSS